MQRESAYNGHAKWFWVILQNHMCIRCLESNPMVLALTNPTFLVIPVEPKALKAIPEEDKDRKACKL
eukprot:2467032-Amphidinium_carterae.1